VQTDIEETYTEIMNGDTDPTEGLNALNEKIQANL
jgi:hypothetical protein